MGEDNTNNFADFDDSLDWGATSDGSDGDSGFADDFTGSSDFDTGSDELVDNQSDGYNEDNFKRSGGKGVGYKTVGIILLVVMIILSGVLIFFDKISLHKKDPVQQQTSVTDGTVGDSSSNIPQQDVGTNDGGSGAEKIVPDESQAVTQANESSGGMQALPADVVIDYTGEVYETSGSVHNKIKYLDNSQVIYCIQVNAQIGEGNKLVNYYCGYNVFDSVSEGENVNITYQIVSDTCYSVNTISK